MQIVGNARLRCENFNGVSDKLKAELIKPVKKDEIIHFQLLNDSFDVALGREGFGASKSIVLKDRIWDKYALNDKGEEVGAYVEIGVPEPSEIKNNIVGKCKKHWVDSIAVGIAGNGQFDLTANSIADMEKYEFFCLSNKNKDNPYRDLSKEPEYEIVYPEKVAAAQSEKDFKELQAKLTRYAKNNPEQAKQLASLLPKDAEKKKDAVTA